MNEKAILVYRPDSVNVEGTITRRTKTLVEVSFEHPAVPGILCTGTFNLKNGRRVRADVYSCRDWWLKTF